QQAWTVLAADWRLRCETAEAESKALAGLLGVSLGVARGQLEAILRETRRGFDEEWTASASDPVAREALTERVVAALAERLETVARRLDGADSDELPLGLELEPAAWRSLHAQTRPLLRAALRLVGEPVMERSVSLMLAL